MRTSRSTLSIQALAPFGLALSLALAGPSRADTIVLTGGRIYENVKVVELGEEVKIIKGLGSWKVSRDEVLRISYDKAPGKDGPEQPATSDTVIFRSGKVVKGTASLSDDGQKVLIERGGNKIEYPREEVARIEWRDGKTLGEADPSLTGSSNSLRKQIDQKVKVLLAKGADSAEGSQARLELLQLGAFDRVYLEELAKSEPQLELLLDDLDRLEGWRKVLPADIDKKVSNLIQRLLESDPEKRRRALEAVAVEAPDSCGALLLHAVTTDPSPEVKSYAVGQMSLLRQYRQLAEVLKVTDGPLRLVAAFALGDAGVYVGIPVVIDALKLPGPEATQIRKVAAQSLTRWTGQIFTGLREGDAPEARQKAIASWEAWWEAEGNDFVRRSLKQVAPELAGAQPTEEEQAEAEKKARQATLLINQSVGREWDKLKAEAIAKDEQDGETQAENARMDRLRRAATLLRQALDLDPALSNTRMTLAAILYEELGQPEAAAKELDRILVRADFDEGDPAEARKVAYYHLAKISLMQRNYQRAAVRFTQAINYDEGFTAAHEGLGDAYREQALVEGESIVDTTRDELLKQASEAYESALDSAKADVKRLDQIMRDLLVEAPREVQEAQVKKSVRQARIELDLEQARLHYKLGRIYGARQKDTEALKRFKEATDLDPENELYRRAHDTWKKLNPPTAPNVR